MKNTIRLVPKQANNSKKQRCKVISLKTKPLTYFYFNINLYERPAKLNPENFDKIRHLGAFSPTSYDVSIEANSESEAVNITKNIFPKGTKFRVFDYINGDGNLYELANAVRQ